MSWLIGIFSYFIGSVPTSYIFSHYLKGRDIRQLGDENAGAANAYRELGPHAGVLVCVIDAAKGAAVILMARAVNLSETAVLVSGVAAVAGHNWPVFLGFRGGRGVSTTLGILFMVITIPMLILTLPTLAILLWRRKVSPAMAFLFIALPLVDWWRDVSPVLIGYGLLLPVIIGITTFFRTRTKALKQAEENKL